MARYSAARHNSRMKVLDLQCSSLHVFEGWFSSEDDFLNQNDRRMIECPICGDASIVKRLSAPRLNLGSSNVALPSEQNDAPTIFDQTQQAAWMSIARRILANTEDVGTGFAEEARKIHYGETKERGIRGQATPAEKEALVEEGISVLTLPLPDALKEPLQ